MRNVKITAIGIGNEFRRDDGVGVFLARRLKEIFPSSLEVMEERGEGAKLMELWKNAERVFLFDAVFSGAQPGTIFRFDAQERPIPKKFFNYSTHEFSLAESVELARVLNQLPHQLIIFGVEGKTFTDGVGLSCEVENAAGEVIRRVQSEINF